MRHSAFPFVSMRSGILLATCAACLTGCVSGEGTIASEGVRISTTPDGATASSNYGDECTTPCVLFLPTDKGGAITIAKSGYQTQVIEIGTKFDKVGSALEAPDIADPGSVAISAAFLAAFGKGMYKNLDRHRLNIVLAPSEEEGAR